MHVTIRSYLTAGVAAVGAGAIALTPVQPMPGHEVVAQKAVSNMAVNLASSIDPITPWVDTFKAAANNIEIMHFDYWANGTAAEPGPFPIMSSIFFNQLTYANWLFNGKAAQIPGQIAENFQKFFAVQREVNLDSMDEAHQGVWTLLPQFVDVPPNLQPLLDLTTTYSSGQFFGLFSPFLAQSVQLVQSFTKIGTFFQNGDLAGAINELINIPANLTNAFLNGGQVLDLTGFVKDQLPPQLTKVGIALGGLLTPGGSVFGALDLGLKPFAPKPPEVPVPGVPAGILTSSIDLGKQLGAAIYVDPNKTVTPPAAAAPAAATAKPAAAAAVSAPEAPAAVVDSTPAAPVVDSTPVADEAPAPAVVDLPAAVEAAAPQEVSAPAPAAVDTPAQAHRGAGKSDSGNGGSGGRGHRGAA